jgi:hypothetical protein
VADLNTDENNEGRAVVVSAAESLSNIEAALANFVEFLGLPSSNILADNAQRSMVFRNIESVILQLDSELRSQSVYLSKFIAAVASGLFDAALNYLWDETVTELRKRVSQYDLSYFFDNAVRSQERRRGLSGEADLSRIDDSELINGARGIGLISDVGYHQLNHVLYMRNWASAAHPNSSEITGIQLLSMAETCIREVMILPLSDIAIEIKVLLSNIRLNTMSVSDAREVGAFFLRLSRDQVANLAQGFFGIYTRDDSSPQARQNVRLLLPFLWDRVDEVTRQQFGIRYGRFVANNDQESKRLAREFLEVVSGEQYFPDDLRAIEIAIAIDNLLLAHRSFNNFHSEPPLARELHRLVGSGGTVPSQVETTYIHGLVEVFLTNGNGTAWVAEPIYRELLTQLNPDQALVAVLSFQEPEIATSLQRSLCKEQYLELLEMMRVISTAPAVKELIDEIKMYKGPFHKMREDTAFMRKLEPFRQILGHAQATPRT